MRVDWIIACHEATVTDRLANIMGAGVDHIRVPSFPAPVTLNLVAHVVGRAEGRTHTLTFSLTAPDGNDFDLPPYGEVDTTDVLEDYPSDWEPGAMVTMKTRLEAQQAGVYVVTAWIDGASRQLPVRIIS